MSGSSLSRFAPCPICGISFHHTKLPMHASECMGSNDKEESKLQKRNKMVSPLPSPRQEVRKESKSTKASRSEATKRSFQLQQDRSLLLKNGKRRREAKGLDCPTRPYPFLVVLDLEWTCDNEAPVRPFSEIIEFSCVLVDTTRRPAKVISDFQRYVKPMHNPILSQFCVELTAISQTTINEQGLPLVDALKEFETWLVSHGAMTNIEVASKSWSTCRKGVAPFAIVTWSDADLGSTLPTQARALGLDRKPWFDEWINLKLAYSSVYKRESRGLRRCVEAIGLTFDGRAHSGLVDSKNTAKIALDMINHQNYNFYRTTRFLDVNGFMIGSRKSRQQMEKKALYSFH